MAEVVTDRGYVSSARRKTLSVPDHSLQLWERAALLQTALLLSIISVVCGPGNGLGRDHKLVQSFIWGLPGGVNDAIEMESPESAIQPLGDLDTRGFKGVSSYPARGSSRLNSKSDIALHRAGPRWVGSVLRMRRGRRPSCRRGSTSKLRPGGTSRWRS